MTAQPEKKKYTPSEYLALEEKAETRNEYWNGEIVAMSGARIDHQQITMNISRVLGNKLYGKCRVFALEMKVWVKNETSFFTPTLRLFAISRIFIKTGATRLIIR